ncbi:hypothetical protein QM565_28855 [Geitlerinema splendidum]|nr:hypothetical protein [Geitlerinema splendidum]
MENLPFDSVSPDGPMRVRKVSKIAPGKENVPIFDFKNFVEEIC